MGIFSNFFGKKKESLDVKSNILTSSDLQDVFGSYGMDSASGIRMSWTRAIRLSTTFACLRVIGNGLAQIPFSVYKSNGETRELAKESDLYVLLHDAPNPYMTSYDFRYSLGMHLALTGNAFAFIERTRKRIYNIYLLSPGSVQVNTNGWEPEYHVTFPDGKSEILTQNEIWHLRTNIWDNAIGLDTVSIARDILGLSAATETFGSTFFAGGGRPSGIVTVPQNVTPEQVNAAEKRWNDKMSGTGNKTIFMQGAQEYKTVSVNNDQSQFLETRKFQIEEVCRAFGVNPILVYYSDKTATYASAEQMFLSHIVHTMSPLYQNIEQSANLFLLSKEERRAGMFCKFNSNALMRGDAKSRSDFYKNMRNIGAMTVNEIRELEELNPVEGGDKIDAPLNSNTSASAESGSQEETPAKEQTNE